jgi:hypothetical protein
MEREKNGVKTRYSQMLSHHGGVCFVKFGEETKH